MGKVVTVKSSRKDNTCGKCRKPLPKGSTYLKGELNFSRPIVRCTECGLQHWEVTTSEFQLTVGELTHNWRDNYGVCEDTVDELKSAIEELRDETQDKLDNMPESLQESSTGELLQERVDMLDEALDELESIDIDDLKSQAVDSYYSDEAHESLADDQEAPDYDEIVGDGNPAELVKLFEESLESAIDDALGNLG